MSSWLFNLILPVLIIASLVGAVFFWGRDKLLKDQSEEKAKDARKDADIANKPHKRGSTLLKQLLKDND